MNYQLDKSIENNSGLRSLMVLLGIFCLLLPTCSTPKSIVQRPWPTTEEVEAAMQAIITDCGIAGLSLSIIQEGKQVDYAVGFADLEQEVRLTPDHRMLLGSTGKTFVAAQTLRLVEQGKIKLDQLAAEFLSEQDWYRALPNWETISLRQLLNHTSGIPEYVYAQELWQGLQANPDRSWTVAERMGFIANADSKFPAGEGWSYADANYIILAAALEKVTGELLYDQLERVFIEPYGLSATVPGLGRDYPRLAAAYTGNFFGELYGEKVAELGKYGFNPQFEWAGGGYISRPHDLARWTQALVSGDVLQATSQASMREMAPYETGRPWSYGLGLIAYPTSYGLAYGHSGFMPGFQTFMAQLTDHGLTIALQINTDPYYKTYKAGTTVEDIAGQLLPVFIQDSATNQ